MDKEELKSILEWHAEWMREWMDAQGIKYPRYEIMAINSGYDATVEAV